MKRMHKKKLNKIYKDFCEVDTWSQFEKILQDEYNEDIVSGMWDFFRHIRNK